MKESLTDSTVARLEVETPEQVQLHLEVAGVGTRSMAFLIDYAVVFLTFVTLLLGAQFATHQNVVDWAWQTNQLLLPLVIITLFLLFWGYFLIFEWLWNGQTPGKRAMHIRVVKDGGYPISFFDSVVRNLLRVVDCYLPPFLFSIGIAAIFIHPRHKRIGDIAARTVVVVERPLHFGAASRATRAGGSNPGFPAMELSMEEMDVIESYLKRRHELDPPSAVTLRGEIMSYLGAKTSSNGQISSIPAEAQDAFLEELIAHHSSPGQS